MKISSILVPVDFSELAESSFLYALEIARVLNASVKVLHVYHIPSMLHAGAFIQITWILLPYLNTYRGELRLLKV